MAVKNLYLTATTGGGWRTVDEATQSAANTGDGWVVSTGSTNHSEYEVGVERAASTFTGTTVPDGSLDSTLKDAFRSTNAYTGDFASANWEFHFVVRAVTNGGAQDGRVRFRLFKANADGSSATEITSGQQQGALVSNVSTSADFDSSLTFNPGAFSVANQYLFIQLAWERTGAGGMTSSDITFRTGSSTTVGTRIVTSDFTSTVTGDLASTSPVPTSAISAAHGVAGDHSATAPAPSSSMSGNSVVGGLSSTLAVPTGELSAAHGVTGDLSSATAVPSSSMAGNTVAGGFTATLGAPTSAIAAAHGIAGDLAATLAVPGGSISAAHGVGATLSSTAPGATSSMGASSVAGGLSATTALPMGAVSATHGVACSVASTTPVPTGSIEATFTAGGGGSDVSGAFASTTPTPTSSMSAGHGVGATVSGALGPPTSSMAAAHGVAGSLSSSLEVPSGHFYAGPPVVRFSVVPEPTHQVRAAELAGVALQVSLLDGTGARLQGELSLESQRTSSTDKSSSRLVAVEDS